MPSTENKARHMAVTEEDLANVKLLKDGKKFGNFVLFFLWFVRSHVKPILECQYIQITIYFETFSYSNNVCNFC